jgi:large subunit ribosomal protein L4
MTDAETKAMALSADIFNAKGEKTGQVELSDRVFSVKAPQAVVHEVITAYLANRRRGTHSTKTRGEVSGGGLKPWKQKHTGRARAGSTRSPLWRHGGVTFGPKPRSYHQAVSPSKKSLAIRGILSDFAKEGRLRVVEGFSVTEPKTKHVAAMAKKLGLPPKSVVVVEPWDAVLSRAAGNLAGVRLCRASDVNGYNLLQAEHLVFTKAALDALTKRLEN